MINVYAKKSLGQHFLTDQNIARKIVSGLHLDNCSDVLEIGPGTGILTRFLSERAGIRLKAMEIDHGLVPQLRTLFPGIEIIEHDFLTADIRSLFEGKFAVIGNFPYNISSRIFFKILEYRDDIPEVVGMLQKEVAERICSGPGNRSYGILSVLLQAFYSVEYLFTVGEKVFNPRPRVKSAVIRLTRNETKHLDCDETLFFSVVKTAFNQRRKILDNAMKPLMNTVPEELSGKRAEQLSTREFEILTRHLEKLRGREE